MLYTKLELEPHRPHDPLFAFDRRPLPPSKAGRRNPVNLLSKTELLSHVKLLVIRQHTTGWCEAQDDALPALPRLEVLCLGRAGCATGGIIHIGHSYSRPCCLSRNLSPEKLVVRATWTSSAFAALDKLPVKTRSSVRKLVIVIEASPRNSSANEPPSWCAPLLPNVIRLKIVLSAGLPISLGESRSSTASVQSVFAAPAGPGQQPRAIRDLITDVSSFFMAQKVDILFVNDGSETLRSALGIVNGDVLNGTTHSRSVLRDLKHNVTELLRDENMTANEIAAEMSKFKAVSMLEYLEKGDNLGELSDTEAMWWKRIFDHFGASTR